MPSFDLETRADVVPRARARVRELLAAWDATELCDAVDLVLSELLGNAVLHAPGPARVVVEPEAGGVRLEVHDSSPTLPVRRSAGASATTGRGLNLVAAICTDWGVHTREDARPGKAVWCVVPRIPQDEVVPDLDLDALLAAFDDDQPQELEVIVGEAPVALLVAAKDHLDGMLRELALAEGGGSLPAEVLEPMVEAVRQFNAARGQLRAQLTDALARQAPRVEVRFRLPAELADVGERYLEVLDRADAFARDRQLLSLESPVEHRVLREWYVSSLVSGLRHAAAGEPPPPGHTFEERLLEELQVLERTRRNAQMGALLQQVTALLARTDTVVDVAAVAVREGVFALAAAGGSLSRSRGGVTVAVAERGDDAGLGAQYLALPLSRRPADPSSECLNTGSAVWVQARKDRDARFPHLASMQPTAVAIAVVPLFAGPTLMGALRLSWAEPRVFGDAERLFLDGLALQAGQALARADTLSELKGLRSQLDLLNQRGGISSTDLTVLRSLYDDLPVAVAVFGTDRRYRSVNPYLARMNGRSEQQHVGRRVGEVTTREVSTVTLHMLRDVLDAALVHGQVQQRDLVIDGGLTMRTSWVPVRDADDQVEAVVLLAVDITSSAAQPRPAG